MAEYTVWNVSYWYSRWSVADENTEVKELAESVAKDLRDKTADKLGDSMKDYFDRVVNGDDDYSLIVYDYRDNDKVSRARSSMGAIRNRHEHAYNNNE